jgi:hypothetical protein
MLSAQPTVVSSLHTRRNGRAYHVQSNGKSLYLWVYQIVIATSFMALVNLSLTKGTVAVRPDLLPIAAIATCGIHRFVVSALTRRSGA